MFKENFPPAPTTERLGLEARSQIFSALTGEILGKGFDPKNQIQEISQDILIPDTYGFPNIQSSSKAIEKISRSAPTINTIDCDGVIVSDPAERYQDGFVCRIAKSEILRSVVKKDSLKGIANLPDNPTTIDQRSVVISRSLPFWPRQDALAKIFDDLSMPFVHNLDRHHPPVNGETPKVWQALENILLDFVDSLNLDNINLNIIHTADILPPLKFLAGNEGIFLHWLGDFLSNIGINVNPSLAFINSSFPEGGMFLDKETLEFINLSDADV